MRADLLAITTPIVIGVFTITGAVTLIIMRTSEQKTIADNLDVITSGYALTVNE